MLVCHRPIQVLFASPHHNCFIISLAFTVNGVANPKRSYIPLTCDEIICLDRINGRQLGIWCADKFGPVCIFFRRGEEFSLTLNLKLSQFWSQRIPSTFFGSDNGHSSFKWLSDHCFLSI